MFTYIHQLFTASALPGTETVANYDGNLFLLVEYTIYIYMVV